MRARIVLSLLAIVVGVALGVTGMLFVIAGSICDQTTCPSDTSRTIARVMMFSGWAIFGVGLITFAVSLFKR